MSAIDAAASTIAPTSTVALANNHFSVEHDGSTIIMSITAGKYFAFDEVGFRIWDALKSPIRIDALAEQLAKAHGASQDVVQRDIIEFIEKLSDAELVVVT